MNYKTLFADLFFISFLMITSCGHLPLNKASNNKTLNEQFQSLHQKAQSTNIKLVAGTYKGKSLRVVIPPKNETPKPLIIALHWAGGGDTYIQYGKCLAEPAFKKLNAYMIIPDAESMVWTNKYNEQKVLELIALAKENWNIDSKKIVVTGYSNGGNGAWFFAEKHPDLINAAIPMASAYRPESKIKIPLYVIHGEKDELFNITRTHNWVNASKEKGSNITFKSVPKLSHYMACDYVKPLKKAVDWWAKMNE
ncbi:MAG TPA: hypothetical protein ENJ53_01460 [Phaeodactylibacter sp.]|nr:hypothetical protein [Phaeodactylibacter sp.]